MFLPDQEFTEHPVHISQDIAVQVPAVHPGQYLAERYHLGDRIGGGGMADVYRGRDVWLCRDVAIKVLKPGMASDEMCARMLQEGRAAAAIDHPHLLRVLDVGRIGESHDTRASFYLVTDLLQGDSLGELLRLLPDGRIGWRRALELVLPALDALDKVHAHGFIHRDLKPDNLFLHRRHGVEMLMVLDLGIAKLAPALRSTSAPQPTETGRVLGTPAYMSPEQANSQPLDHRTDIYSIGVTLHRMLAGRLPFEVRPGDSPYVLMAHHLYDPPPRLADELVPEALADLVLRSLAKAPAERPQTMLQFAEELRACLTTPHALSVPTRTFERSGDLHRVGRIFGGMAVLGALVAFRGPEPLSRWETALLVPERDVAVVSPPKSIVARGAVAVEQLLPGVEPREPAVSIEPVLPVTMPVVTGEPVGRLAAGDEPAQPMATPVATGTPEVEPASSLEPPRELPRSPPRRRAAVAEVFIGAEEQVSRCMRDHGNLDLRELTVSVRVRPDGTVARSVVHDGSAARLCIRPILERLRFPPGPAQELGHKFQRMDQGAR